MYLRYQLMKTLQDERLRAAARDHLAAEARRALTAGRDHAAATGAGATATMPRKQGATIGLGIPLGAILLFPQGIIPAVLKLAQARGRMWFLPLYLPKPLQWPACFVMIILGVAVYCYVLWTMRQLKKSSREIHTGKGGGRSPKSAPTPIGTGQDLGGAPRDASAPWAWHRAARLHHPPIPSGSSAVCPHATQLPETPLKPAASPAATPGHLPVRRAARAARQGHTDAQTAAQLDSSGASSARRRFPRSRANEVRRGPLTMTTARPLGNDKHCGGRHP